MTGKPSSRTVLEALEAYKAKVLEWQKSRPPKSFLPEPVAEKLRLDYQKACNNYVVAFCEKQDVCFDGWIGDAVGEIACFADYVISLHDIIYDIDNRVPKGIIFD